MEGGGADRLDNPDLGQTIGGNEFHPKDAEAILRIPLSRRLSIDKLFWLHNREGKYKVKSGYHLAKQLEREAESQRECSKGVDVNPVWCKLWKLKLPNKIKIFMWRACHNILPTSENLVRRRVIDDSTCELCQREMESVLHVLWECNVAMHVWTGSSKRIHKCGGSHNSFMQLLEMLFYRLPVEEVEMFVVQAWLLWTQRNKVKTGGIIQDPTQLVKQASVFLEEYRASQDHLAVPVVVKRSSRWVPPPENRFKLNFDAAIFQEIHASGFGAIIRNERGKVMASFSARGPSAVDSEEAKLLACRRALEFAIDTGLMDIVVEGDNSVVMKDLLSSRTEFSRLGHLYEDVKGLAARMTNLTVSCVQHIANSVAHSLTRFAKNIDDVIVWMEDSPPVVLEALYFDSS